MTPIEHYRLLFDFIAYRYLHIDPYDEEGLTSTEWAVLGFLAVAIAGMVGGIVYQRAKTMAEKIPATPPTPAA